MAWAADFGTQVPYHNNTERDGFYTKVVVSESKIVAVSGQE
jgi:hypothetical protein